MNGFEYEAIFIGIIVGLSIQNVLWSFHKLVEAGRRVRWHWMAPVFAFEAVILTLGTFWFYWYGHFVAGRYMTSFLEFLSFAIGMGLLFLTCAASLPDEVPEAGIDLETYYYANRLRMWGFTGAYSLLNSCAWAGIAFAASTSADLHTSLVFLGANLIATIASVVLIFVRARWLHTVYLIYGVVALLVLFGPMKLTI